MKFQSNICITLTSSASLDALLLSSAHGFPLSVIAPGFPLGTSAPKIEGLGEGIGVIASSSGLGEVVAVPALLWGPREEMAASLWGLGEGIGVPASVELS